MVVVVVVVGCTRTSRTRRAYQNAKVKCCEIGGTCWTEYMVCCVCVVYVYVLSLAGVFFV